jgi:hypothetical protein
MDTDAYNAAWQALNDRAKAGEITTDELLAARRELNAKRESAVAQAKESVKAQAKAAVITTRVEAQAQSRATSEHELQMRLNAQDDRVRMLERKARATHVPPEVMVAALALLESSRKLQNDAARMLGVR